MRRLVPGLALLVVILNACSSGAAPETPDAEVTVTSSSSSTSTTTTPEVTTTYSGRPVAPDFTLALGDGGSYTLSEGERPVYLVFWAEW